MLTRMKRILPGVVLAAAALGADAGEPARTILDVKGMSCAACPLTVKAVLRKQPGVSEVKMDSARHTAEVAFDRARTSPEQLARAVGEAGFPATPRK